MDSSRERFESRTTSPVQYRKRLFTSKTGEEPIWSGRRDSIRGAQRALVGRCSDVPPARHSLQFSFESPRLYQHRKNSSPAKPVKSLSGAGDGIQFAARGAPWSVSVLTCRRHVIHYSSPSNPHDFISIEKLFTSKTGEEPIWSGRRDSNPRHSAWEADALPLNYSRIKVRI